MDRVSSWMVRASFGWLLAGVTTGAVMMVDDRVPGAWRGWMGTTHAHMLMVGWLLQFALGVAFWLLPRSRAPKRPLGYAERPALVAVIVLNAGMLLRALGEPAERAGHASGWTELALVLSAAAQVAAIVSFVSQLWPRAAARAPRRPATAERGAASA